MAKIDVVFVPPVPPPTKEYIITLSSDEVKGLEWLLHYGVNMSSLDHLHIGDLQVLLSQLPITERSSEEFNGFSSMADCRNK